jgi:hypothetical protein
VQVHGGKDKVMALEHAQSCCKSLVGADLVVIEDMGAGLPAACLPAACPPACLLQLGTRGGSNSSCRSCFLSLRLHACHAGKVLRLLRHLVAAAAGHELLGFEPCFHAPIVTAVQVSQPRLLVDHSTTTRFHLSPVLRCAHPSS